MNDEIVINGKTSNWLEECVRLAKSRTPFILVEFDYMSRENNSYCRDYIEQEHGYLHECVGTEKYRFTPLPDFERPTHNHPPDFNFSDSPEN
jgi:hypothetical protein